MPSARATPHPFSSHSHHLSTPATRSPRKFLLPVPVKRSSPAATTGGESDTSSSKTLTKQGSGSRRPSRCNQDDSTRRRGSNHFSKRFLTRSQDHLLRYCISFTSGRQAFDAMQSDREAELRAYLNLDPNEEMGGWLMDVDLSDDQGPASSPPRARQGVQHFNPEEESFVDELDDDDDIIERASQLGGGRRAATPPPPLTQTRLRTRMSPTKRDNGIIKGAIDRRSRLLETAEDSTGLNMSNAVDKEGQPSLPSASMPNAEQSKIPSTTTIRTSEEAPPDLPPHQYLHPDAALTFNSSHRSASPEHNIAGGAFAPMNRRAFSEPLATIVTDPLTFDEDKVDDTPAEPHHPNPFLQPLERSPVPERWVSEVDVLQDDHDDHIPPEGSTGGRISHFNLQILEEGFLELDTLIVNLSDKTSLPLKQIISLWDKRSTASTNPNKFHPWNSYMKYFKAHAKEELKREYGANGPPQSNGDASKVIRLACYRSFQAAYPTTWKTILQKHDDMLLTSDGSMTIATRCQTFNKSFKSMQSLADSYAVKYGFQTAFVMAGNAVNQDHALAEVHMTSGAKEFFSSRLRLDNHAVIGHFKTHIYDDVSRYQIDELDAARTDTTAPAQRREHRKEKGKGKDIKSSTEASSGGEGGEGGDDTEQQDGVLELIKRSLTGNLNSVGGMWKKSLFPWKKMSQVIARQAIVLQDYPEGVRLPGDEPQTGRSKGISDLNSHERITLLDALRDPVRPVHFVSYPERRANLVRNREPSIIGVAPPHNSEHQHGRRKFANGDSDRKGLPRRGRSPEGSEASPGEAPAAPEDGPMTRSRSRSSKTTSMAPKAKTVRGKRVVKSAAIVVSGDDSSADDKENSDSEDSAVEMIVEDPARRKHENGKTPTGREPRGTSAEDGIPVDSSSCDDALSGQQTAPKTRSAAATTTTIRQPAGSKKSAATSAEAAPLGPRPRQQQVEKSVAHPEAHGALANPSAAHLDTRKASNVVRHVPLAQPIDKVPIQQEARVTLEDSSEARSDTTLASNDALPDARQASVDAPRTIPETNPTPRRASNKDPGAVDEVSIRTQSVFTLHAIPGNEGDATASKTARSYASKDVPTTGPGRKQEKGKQRVRIAGIDTQDDNARMVAGAAQSKTRLPIGHGTDDSTTTFAPPPKAAMPPAIDDGDDSEPVPPGRSRVKKKRTRLPYPSDYAEADDIPSKTLTAAKEAHMEVDTSAIARSRMENIDVGSKRKHQEGTSASAEPHKRPRPTARSTSSVDATSENDLFDLSGRRAKSTADRSNKDLAAVTASDPIAESAANTRTGMMPPPTLTNVSTIDERYLRGSDGPPSVLHGTPAPPSLLLGRNSGGSNGPPSAPPGAPVPSPLLGSNSGSADNPIPPALPALPPVLNLNPQGSDDPLGPSTHSGAPALPSPLLGFPAAPTAPAPPSPLLGFPAAPTLGSPAPGLIGFPTNANIMPAVSPDALMALIGMLYQGSSGGHLQQQMQMRQIPQFNPYWPLQQAAIWNSGQPPPAAAASGSMHVLRPQPGLPTAGHTETTSLSEHAASTSDLVNNPPAAPGPHDQ